MGVDFACLGVGGVGVCEDGGFSGVVEGEGRVEVVD